MARTINPIQDRQRRAALEQAAYLALYEQGLSAVTLATIAKHAGVSAGTLIYHFGSRAGLLCAVMQRFTHTFTVATRRALRQAKTPEAKLRTYVENQFFSIESTQRFHTVALDFLVASTRDPELMRLQQDFLQQTLALDLELVRALLPTLSDEAGMERAKLLRALIEGLSVRFLADAAPDLATYRAECASGAALLLGLGNK